MRYDSLYKPFDKNFELNRESSQAKGLRGWWNPIKGRGTNQLPNLWDRNGIGTLGTSSVYTTFPSIGTVLTFDGTSNSSISLGANPAHKFTNEISLFGWVYPHAAIVASQTRSIFSISNDITVSGWEYGFITGQAFAYHSGTTGIQGWFQGTTTLSLDRLYYMGFSYKPGTLNFYLDGVSDGSPTVDSSIINFIVGDITLIGAQPQNSVFDGGIGDLRIYNRFFTPSEAYQLYDINTRFELYRPIFRPAYYKVSTGSQTVDFSLADVTALGYAPNRTTGSINAAVNLADNPAIGLSVVTRHIQTLGLGLGVAVGNNITTQQNQVVGKADNPAIGNNVGYSVGSVNSSVGNSANTAIGKDVGFTTGSVNSIVGKSDALAIGKDLTYSTGLVNSTVGKSDNTAIGNALTTKYIQGLGYSDNVAVGKNLTTRYNQVVGKSDNTAIGNNLTIRYIQIVGKADNTAIGNNVGYSAGSVNSSVNKADAIAISYSPTTNYYQIIGKADALAIGKDLIYIAGSINSTVGKSDNTALGYVVNHYYVQPIIKADAVAIGYSLVTNQYQVIGKSDVLAIGKDLTYAVGSVNSSIGKADSLAIGKDVDYSTGGANSLVNKADAIALGNNVGYTTGSINATVGLGLGVALGNGLTTNRIQSIGNALATALGKDVSFTVGSVTIPINTGLAVAIGFSITSEGQQVTQVGLSNNTAIGYGLSTKFIQIVNKALVTAIGYDLTNSYIISVNKADALAVGKNVNNTQIQIVGLGNVTGIGYNVNPQLIQTINTALVVALGNNTGYSVGITTKSVNVANAIALGYLLSVSTFTLILSPDRIYKPLIDDRIYIPLEDRIYKVR